MTNLSPASGLGDDLEFDRYRGRQCLHGDCGASRQDVSEVLRVDLVVAREVALHVHEEDQYVHYVVEARAVRLEDESDVVDDRVGLRSDVVVQRGSILVLDRSPGKLVGLGCSRTHAADEQQIAGPVQVRVCSDR